MLMWFGVYRYVWNFLYDTQMKKYEQSHKISSIMDMLNEVNLLINDGRHGWLREFPQESLEEIVFNFNSALQDFLRAQSDYFGLKSRKHSKTLFPIEGIIGIAKHQVMMERFGCVQCSANFNLTRGQNQMFAYQYITQTKEGWVLSFSITDRDLSNKKGVLR